MATETKSATNNVESIMSQKVQTVEFDSSVADALRLMVDAEHNTIPVVDRDRCCVGILSRSDLTETLLNEDRELAKFLEASAFTQLNSGMLETCNEKLVREVMTHNVTSISPSTPINTACKLMAKEKIHHLPVVSKSNVLLGIVSAFDVVKWHADQ